METNCPKAIMVASLGDHQNLRVPKTSLKSYGDRAFCHAAPVMWNYPPLEIKTTTIALDVFKFKVKYHLLKAVIKL